MKICQYCGTAQENDVTVCPACGGNAFYIRCKSCGALYEGGDVCPQCGVSRWVLPKICPKCSHAIYGAVCPQCGYQRYRQPQEDAAPAQEEKTRRLLLWVLGWLFCFPIPLTVLIVRTDKLKLWLKVVLIVLVWAFYIGIGFARDPIWGR